MLTDKSKCLNKILPILLLFALALLFFSPVILQDRTFFAFDTLLTYLPWSSEASTPRPNNSLITDPVNMHYLWHQFIQNCIKQKILPLWNDLNFSGYPFSTGYTPHGNPIVFLFYLFFPLTIAHDLVLWCHLFGAGLLMFLYLKQMDYKIFAALMGAVAWMFNGYVMVFFEIESIPILAFSLPAALLFFERWLKTRSQFDCLCFTAVAAIAISSGFTHHIILQLLFVSCYMLYRHFSEKRRTNGNKKIRRRDWYTLGLAMILLCLLSANFVTSHLLLLEDPQRSPMSFDALYQRTGKLPLKYLTTMVFPDFFGNPSGNITFTPRMKNAQPYNNYSELCIYTGVLTLFLVSVCIPYFRRRGLVCFYTISAILTLTMAMGSLLYYPLARFIPGLSFSSPTRILFIFGFSMSVLAATGANILTNVEDKKKASILAIWILLLCITVTVSILVQTAAGMKWASGAASWNVTSRLSFLLQNHFSLTSPTLLKPLLLAVISFLGLSFALYRGRKNFRIVFLFLGLLILSYDLVSFGLRYNTASPRELEYPETDAIRFLQADKSKFRIISFGNFLHNSFAAYNLSDVGGYHSFYPKRYGEFLHLSQYGSDAPLPDRFHRWTYFRTFGSPLLDLINVKYLLLPPAATIDSSRLKPVYDKEIMIFENMNAFPRVFWVPSYEYCHNREASYKKLGSYTLKDFRAKVILESRPPSDFKQLTSPEFPERRPQINFLHYGPNRIDLSVSTDKAGFLVLSDNYHPGWKAEIDGETVKILRANYIMRAIPIKKGSHSIMFSFKPGALRAGICISTFAWIVLALLLIRSVLKKKMA